jgi:hypothetical protein
MANTIKIKNSGNATAIPSTLEHGELGLNYADGKLFYKNSSNVIVEFGGAGSTSLDGLTDVIITSPIQFQGLIYDGTGWVNSSVPNTYLVRNNTGSTLLKGTLVSAVGAEPSGRIDVAPFEVTGTENSELRVMGIVVSNISNGVNGEVISFGTLTGLDTRGSEESSLAVGDETWAAGDILYAHPTVDGKLTNVKPQHDLAVAFITIRHASSGQIAIRIVPGNNHLEWMHDVSITDKTSGDFLKYNGTLWVNDPINLGTDTTGNYMSNVTAGNLITVTHTPGEGSSAAIAVSNGTSGQIIVANATGVPTWVTESGDLTIDSSGVTSITSNVIVNADINTSAAIAHSKLANATAGQILLGTTTTGVVTATTVTGDVTITGAGVTAIASNTIVNADINSAAAISLSKLASGSSAQVVLGNATGVPTFTTISGDIAVSNTGVVTIQANSVALGTDTTGNYVASLVAGSGITLANNSGESATPTVGLTSNSLTINGTSIALGGSGTITANAATLTGTSLNSSVVGSSLTSVGTLTSLTVSGNVAVTGSVVDHVITNSQTGTSYTLVLADDGKFIEMGNTSNITLTIPADNTVNFPVGTSIDILQTNTGQIIIASASGVTTNSSPGTVSNATSGPKTRTRWSSATLIKRAANTWVAVGDLSA